MLYLPLRFGVCGAVVPLYPEAFVVLSLCSRPCPVTLTCGPVPFRTLRHLQYLV